MLRLCHARLRAQIVKELLSLLRDPRSRIVLIVPPLMQLLIFSFAATLELNHVNLAVYNRDTGRASHELLAELGAAGFVDHLFMVHSRAERRALIDHEQVIAAIEIPPDFSRDVVAGRTATAQVILDGRQANAARTRSIISTRSPPGPGPCSLRAVRTRVTRRSCDMDSTRISSTAGMSCPACRASSSPSSR